MLGIINETEVPEATGFAGFVFTFVLFLYPGSLRPLKECSFG